MRTGIGAMRAVEQAVGALHRIVLEPLVAGLAANAVASAEPGVREEAAATGKGRVAAELPQSFALSKTDSRSRCD